MQLKLKSLESLSERERRMVIIGAACVVLLLVFGVILPLDHSVARTQAHIAAKQADLAWMREVSPELLAAGPAVAAPTSERSMLVIVDRAAREAGLAKSLTSSEPSGPGGLQVRLEKAPFDAVVGWLARLSEQEGIRVDSATIDNAGQPGIINAGVVLHAR
ncbi:MAG TPA: type II secretion system protein M [Steroidobacteraceae bacterium]